MSKRYEIRVPRRSYPQIIFISVLFIFHVITNFNLDNLSYLYNLFACIISIIILIIIVIQVISISRFGNEIEITHNSIISKDIELPINEIEIITIEGYFVQSIGIKRIGQRFVSTSLHFRFKNNEEEQVKEWEQWAESNGIKVVKGTIYSWI